MKTKKKTVTAWAWAVAYLDGSLCEVDIRLKRSDAVQRRSVDNAVEFLCGPVVKIELPLPKEKKR